MERPSDLQIYLFGHLRASYQGHPLALKYPPKTAPLWCYLLLHRDTAIARSTLAFLLWPDEPEVEALAKLRRHLYQLKRVLPEPPEGCQWLITSETSVRWNPHSACWIDVVEFERLSAGDETLAEAAELYGGELLVDLYDDWLLYERQRLQDRYFATLGELIVQARQRRDLRGAIRYAGQLLARDPLREDIVRQLMGLRYEAGDRAGALREYEQFLQQLRRELGVEPMPETAALFEAIFRQLPIPSPFEAAQPGELARGPRAPLLPFSGREQELSVLQAAWNHAARGAGKLLLLAGEAGVGKTRLATEFSIAAEHQGARVLRGSTTMLEPQPYEAIVAALRSTLPLLAALEMDPHWLATLTLLLPELPERRAGAATAPQRRAAPAPSREQLFEAVFRCFAALARVRPLIVILEDMHWAGATTIELLEWIVARLPEHPMLFLASYRHEEATRSHPLRELSRRLKPSGSISSLALGRLSAEAVTALVKRLSAERPRIAGLASQLHAVSEGNPFFLGQLIRDQLESDGGAPTAPAASVLPGGMREILLGRIERLSQQTWLLLGIVAVIGTSFNVEFLRKVSGWEENLILDSVDELIDRSIVRETGRADRYNFDFTHHLIQSLLYDEIPPGDRRRRHRRIALIMEELGGERRDDLAGELAEHFDRGGEPERAAGYYLGVARRALAVYADEEALGALRRGLELSRAPEQRFALLIEQEAVHHRHGSREAQAANLAELESLAEQLNDGERICQMLLRRIRLLHATGERQQERALIAALHQRAASAGSEHWLAEACCADAAYQLAIGAYDDAHALLLRALPLYEQRSDLGGQIAAYCLLTELAVQRGDFARCQELLASASRLAEQRGDQQLLARTVRAAAAAAFTRQDFDAALALNLQLLDLGQTVGDREAEADAHARLGAVLARLFRIVDAHSHYRQAAALYQTLGKRQGQAGVLVNSAMLLVNGPGHYEEGRELLLQARELFDALSDLRGQTVCMINLGMVAFHLRQYEQARDDARTALAMVRQIKNQALEALVLSNLGAAERELGDLEAAIAHMGLPPRRIARLATWRVARRCWRRPIRRCGSASTPSPTPSRAQSSLASRSTASCAPPTSRATGRPHSVLSSEF